MTRHLDLVTRIPCVADQFVIAGNHLYASARYGDAYQATIVDLSDVTAPRVVSTVKCRRQTPSVAVVGDVMFVGEYHRSILLVDVANPAKPEVFDAVVAFRRDLTHFHVLGNLLVAAADDEGIFALDVANPRQVKQLPVLPIPGEESSIDQLTVRDGIIYAAAREAGCAVVEVADGRLRERQRIAPDGYRVSHVLATEKCLWLFGNGEDDDASLIVLDRATGEQRFRGKGGISHPNDVIDVPGGGIAFHSHYSATLLSDSDARLRTVFKQYEYRDDQAYIEIPMIPRPRGDDEDRGDDDDGDDDDSEKLVEDLSVVDHERRTSCMESVDCSARHAGHLVTANGREELIVWKPRPGSIFGGDGGR